MNNGRLIENTKIHVSTYSLTSAGTTSASFNANDCAEVSIIVGCGTVIGGVQSTVTVLQSADKNMTTSAGLSTATLSVIMGSTVANTVERASGLLITMTSATAQTVLLNGVTLTHTSATGVASTGGFGSTVGTTVDTGQQLACDALISLINSTYGSSVIGPGGLGGIMRASSGTTATVNVIGLDSQENSSGITWVSTGTLLVGTYLSQQVGLSFKTDELASTSNYFRPAISTASSVARACSITVIKSGLRYDPNFSGPTKIST